MTEPTTAKPANGELVNRVQQLRLNTQIGAGKTARSGTSWLPWVLCALLALSWAGVGIRGYKSGAYSPTSSSAGSTTGSGSESSPAKSQSSGPIIPGTIDVSESGYLVPAQTIAVSPIDVGGRVVELNVVEGKLFKKGQVLARLEDTSYKAQVAEAVASLKAAEKRLEAAKMKLAVLLPDSVRKIEMDQAEEELKEAEAQRERANDQYTRLGKLGPGVSEQELRQARFDFEAAAARARRLGVALVILKEGPRQEMKAGAEADVKSAEADVKGAEARLVQAQWRLDNCTITAPIDGTILNKKAELGNLVNPMAFSASTSGGGAVCDMANLTDMEADLEIAEREIGKLVVGQRCRIKCPVAPDRFYEGRLDRIMPIGNRARNIVNVRVKVKLPEGEVPGSILKPEMRAEVVFLANETK
jgi:multidrug resistance efflux pump